MKSLKNKVLVILLKYVPVVFAMGIFIGAICTLNDVIPFPANIISGSSLISNFIAHAANKTFNYCKWHIILVYYVYLFLFIITLDYYIEGLNIYYNYIDSFIIISLVIFAIAYFNRNKK